MVKGKLSDRQRKILDYIQDFTLENGYPPSIREIGSAVGITSTSVVNYNLNRLVEEGYLDRDQNISRGIRLTEKFARAVELTADMVRIPMAGRIFASEPVMIPSTDSAIFSPEEAIQVSRDLLSVDENLFALEVKGDSMIDGHGERRRYRGYDT